MKVIACYAGKGGVGKTAAAVNLSWLAAADGMRTLLWDLDPQAAASYLLRVKPKVKGGTKRLLQGRSEAVEAVRQTTEPGLDLLPADSSYAHADIDLDEAKRSEDRVTKVLGAFKADYDVVFLDAPPGLSLLSVNVVRSADLLLVPLAPSPLSLRTLDQVVDLVKQQEDRAISVLAFLSMVDKRRALHRDVVAQLGDRFGDVARTSVPLSALVERMGQRRRPVVATAPASPASQAYADLWAEVKTRLLP